MTTNICIKNYFDNSIANNIIFTKEASTHESLTHECLYLISDLIDNIPLDLKFTLDSLGLAGSIDIFNLACLKSVKGAYSGCKQSRDYFDNLTYIDDSPYTESDFNKYGVILFVDKTNPNKSITEFTETDNLKNIRIDIYWATDKDGYIDLKRTKIYFDHFENIDIYKEFYKDDFFDTVPTIHFNPYSFNPRHIEKFIEAIDSLSIVKTIDNKIFKMT